MILIDREVLAADARSTTLELNMVIRGLTTIHFKDKIFVGIFDFDYKGADHVRHGVFIDNDGASWSLRADINELKVLGFRRNPSNTIMGIGHGDTDEKLIAELIIRSIKKHKMSLKDFIFKSRAVVNSTYTQIFYLKDLVEQAKNATKEEADFILS